MTEQLVLDGIARPVLRVPAKRLRAGVIAHHLGTRPALCFTSGNAGNELVNAGVDVLVIGGSGPLMPGRWWEPAEIAVCWPGRFDATSGHLPMFLMARLAMELRAYVQALPPSPVLVPTGSGETLAALHMAFPDAELWALTHLDEHTDHHAGMPLADLVARHRVIDARQVL